MKIKCDYCGAEMNNYDSNCPNCRRINSYLKKNTNKEPETIEELKQWYIDRNLPDENVTRFFIGKNYKKPKAFGIYKDEVTGNFVVYKNKASGERAVRYEGKDEVYAVRELYKKLKDEIYNQKHNRSESENDYSYTNKLNTFISIAMSIPIIMIIIMAIITIIMIIIGLILTCFLPQNGYYHYNDDYYYYQNSSWYEYDDNYGWYYTSVDDELRHNYRDYYYSRDYNYSYDTSRFEDSSYYIEPSSSSSGSDSSWDWDSSDSWDSGSTDWDSDW